MSAHRWRSRGQALGARLGVLRFGLSIGLGIGLGIGLLGISGCEEPRPGPASEPASAAASQAEREAARALLTQITAIATPPARADMLLHAIDVGALMALVVPPEVPFVPADASLAATGSLADCLLSTGSAATLSECELGDHVIDGTWSLQYPATHTELVDVFVVGPRDHGSLWVDARLTVVERAMDSLPDMPSVRGIDGDIEISLMWSADHREYALDASIHVDDLAVDPGGTPEVMPEVITDVAPDVALEHAGELGPRPLCAVGGAVTIRGSVSTGEQSRLTLWLGPGCREVHVVRSAGP